MFSTFAIATMYAISSNHEPVYTGRSSVRWDATGMLLVDPVYTGIPLGDPANIAGHTGTPLEKLSWSCHTEMPLEKLWLLQPTLEHHWMDYNSPYTLPGTYDKQSGIHASLKWKDDGTPNSKWTGLRKISFTWSLLLSICIPVLLFKRVSTSTSLSVCLGYEQNYSFYVLRGCSTNEISLAPTTLTIPVVYIRGCMLGSDLT